MYFSTAATVLQVSTLDRHQSMTIPKIYIFWGFLDVTDNITQFLLSLVILLLFLIFQFRTFKKQEEKIQIHEINRVIKATIQWCYQTVLNANMSEGFKKTKHKAFQSYATMDFRVMQLPDNLGPYCLFEGNISGKKTY